MSGFVSTANGLAAIVTALLLRHCVYLVECKGVHVTVVASWTETPLLQEGCEAVARLPTAVGVNTENGNVSGFYWCLEDVWRRAGATNVTGGAQTMTQKVQYDLLMAAMRSGNYAPRHVALLTAKLAARVHSPTVEAHRQLARKTIRIVEGCSVEGRPFALLASGAICDAQELSKAIQRLPVNVRRDGGTTREGEKSEHEDEVMSIIPDLDHVHPQFNGPNLVIVYGIVGEAMTMQLLHAAMRHGPAVRVVFRHLPVSGKQWDELLPVQGYGVTVDVKSTEYRVVDDRGSEASVEKLEQRLNAEGGSRDGGMGIIGGFNVSMLKERYPNHSAQLDNFKEALIARLEKEIKVDYHPWERPLIGIGAIRYILDSSREPLGALLDLLTNFPARASRVSKLGLSGSGHLGGVIHYGLEAIGQVVGRGTSHVFLNGRSVSPEHINIFYIIEKMEEYEALISKLSAILGTNNTSGTAAKSAVLSLAEMLQQERLGSHRGKQVPRLWIPKEIIHWVNDVEKNPFLYQLPTTLRSVLSDGDRSPRIPKRNLFHVTGIVDPTTMEGLTTLFEMYRRAGQPVRFGFVLVDRGWSPEVTITSEGMGSTAVPESSKITVSIAATFWELTREEESDEKSVSEFLLAIVRSVMTKHSITEAEVNAIVQETLQSAMKRTLDEIVVDPDFIVHYQEAQEMIHSLKLKRFPVVLVNGQVQADISTALQHGIVAEFAHVQQLVETDALDDEDNNLYDAVLKLSEAKTHFFEALYEDKTYVNWESSWVMSFLHKYPFFAAPGARRDEPSLVSGVLAIQAPLRPQSLQAIQKLLRSLSLCKKEKDMCNRVRVTHVFCGIPPTSEHRTVVRDLQQLQMALREQTDMNETQRLDLLEEFLTKVIEQSDPQGRLDSASAYAGVLKGVKFSEKLQTLLSNLAKEGASADRAAKLQQYSTLSSNFCENTVTTDETPPSTDVGAIHYYANGRRFVYSDDYIEDDFKVASLDEIDVAESVWASLEVANYSAPPPGMEKSETDQNIYASKVSSVTATLLLDAWKNDRSEERKLRLPSAGGPMSFVIGPASGADPVHRLTVVLDPMSRVSQHLASLCDYVARMPIGATCTVYLNPTSNIEKMMRNYYQFVGETELRFDAEGAVMPPAAVFSHLPERHVLTLGVEEPECWTVFPMEAEHDLDNIILSKLPPSSHFLHATYRLNSILISGSAINSDGSMMPSSGLPLQIRPTRSHLKGGGYASAARDTLVMTIKGYFQLQSAPGVWYLTVQPGDVARVFYISQFNEVPVRDAANSPQDIEFNHSAGQAIPVSVSSFTGSFVQLGIAKVAGYGKTSIEDITAAAIEKSNTEWPPKGPQKERPETPTLNIFSVASGHLYERFLRIMMHTVMKTSSDVHGANTTRIKFWLIENFLSPRFKELVPLLAEHYGFDVSFVTYRWPWWLNKQTEKQRIIWAYKILFLDVLFPLNVDRVIFVDADQIVRSDLHELYNMDIGDAPVAYTPFCRDHPNTATTNFRFWDRGFWLEHLRGKPYHISALYLVNVQRLRAMLGGDKYRATYASLSHDPGSLANLDQDLPNFMQDTIPIFSLPEEWLWCETWCADSSKARAKTIDLCNNPLTKKPKLENVRHIVEGWDDMDSELEDLSNRLLKAHAAKHKKGVEKSGRSR